MTNASETSSALPIGATTDEATIQKYANDASIFEVRPSAVVFPKTIDEIRSLVRFVNERRAEGDTKTSLTARAAGTDMSGGPLSESIVLDTTKHLNRIKSVTETEGVAEPGVFYRDFETETLKKGVIMPSYPASKRLCALGGMVGNNAGGEKALTYGSTVRHVKRLKVVLADGNEYEFHPLTRPELDQKMAQQDYEGALYRAVWNLVQKNQDLIAAKKPRVSKNSTGYFIWDVWDGTTFDLTKLFVGSQGTLGLITEITFALVRPNPHTSMVVAFLKEKDFPKLGEIVNAVLAHKPETFESYDDHTFGLAIHYFPDMVKTMKSGLVSLGLRFLPEFWMVLTGGVPKLILMPEFTGTDQAETDARALAAKTALEHLGVQCRVTSSPQDTEKYWAVRRESFSLLRKHIKKERTAPFIDDIIVSPEKLPEFLPRLNEIMSHYKIIFTIAGHIGDGNFHIIPLMDFTKPESKVMYKELIEKVFDLVFEFGGSMSGEHNDGIVRTPFLEKMYGQEMCAVFADIKRAFDPQNIFNPGKKVGDTLAYAMEHIDTVY
ncbi:MAG: hypothetical protein A2408_03715 [Candidatus Yonathbacteria bacterium RIFOXYC1_FULL_52_10]|uniref:FAD-binding PCMH-type domain-containing protein n=1 Tax=Candidatus Yonathbacteria bacterium RIFOXYD1_FULL_52_36 TaxID=1802730 RepID=A0A1G2SN34_9BACT|nr:MAG: hypothetical protein A2408_03715 [Candidatus Yonathbacteria bacterium RIFOXYC1_FULL_52_10]OHA86417.1 MAG: hypothetical protein A2591_03140 [Candidatus Yonathbacteria bacterium RIFOXYD1_FULL_52_36]